MSQSILVVLSSATLQDLKFLDSTSQGVVSLSSVERVYEEAKEKGRKVVFASPGGASPQFDIEDLSLEQWFAQNNSLFSSLTDLSTAREEDYVALVIPNGIGALSDLHQNQHLSSLVATFIRNKKPICAIGYGVAALLKVQKEEDESNQTWFFENWNLTSISNFELARYPFFFKLPLLIEDSVRERGGSFSAGAVDSLFVVADRYLITAANTISTSLAMQNLLWLCSS
eukprot:TRINITY_DN9384_c0_g1_i1.p1 TRINITY_DN9384_c0_g1~~TRINITY_DN9384_c0_g1_i1.p1  ORF type:complete len:228 (+),score=69.82 TRINITY_DN9384_c0_g1_i1:43-726(+)